jgi:hypothetical protein
MEVKIYLTEEAIDKLLKAKGYEVKEVLVHYPKFHYTTEGKYGKYWRKIVYPKDNKPKLLDKEFITSFDIDGMTYEKVVNDLFNEVLIEKLLN